MIVYWKDSETHIVNLDDSIWHLYCELDRFEDAVLALRINDITWEICWSDEYIHGLPHRGLTPEHVLKFYSAIVSKVYEIIKNDSPAFLDISQIKEDLIPSFWFAWKKEGLVKSDHW